MLPQKDSFKRYHSAHARFARPAIENFLTNEIKGRFGPSICSALCDGILDIVDKNFRDTKTIQPGQVLWNAVHKDTRADSHNVKFVPVVLTLLCDQDITNLENGMTVSTHKQNVLARILKETYKQGALLSMRDVNLLLGFAGSGASAMRKAYEQRTKETLPHTGNLHDMGSCITHKYQIIYKHVVEKKDTPTIARQTNHTLFAVERYLKDFNRIKMLYLDGKDVDYIHHVTGRYPKLIKEYIGIINQHITKERSGQ